MSEKATRPMRVCESISCWITFVIVRFASGLMLRETSSTSIPPVLPGTRPRSAAARLRPVSIAATTRPTSTTAKVMRSSSVRRAAGASVAVVPIGIVAPRRRPKAPTRRRRREAVRASLAGPPDTPSWVADRSKSRPKRLSVSIRPLFDHLADVEGQRLRQRRQRRRLRPRELLGDEGEVGLAAPRQLVREQLERLALVRRLRLGALDEHDCALQRAKPAQPQRARDHEAQQREQREREQQPADDEEDETQRVR